MSFCFMRQRASTIEIRRVARCGVVQLRLMAAQTALKMNMGSSVTCANKTLYLSQYSVCHGEQVPHGALIIRCIHATNRL